MPYGKTARSVRAYEFGCLPPTAGESAALDAMFGRVRLWNNLVEMERAHQAQLEALLAPHLPAPGESQESRAAYKAARKAAWKLDQVKSTAAALEKEAYGRAGAICRESGLYWCDYEAVKTAWQLARRKPGDLRFHSARNEPGKVSVRYQTGLPASQAFACDTRMQIGPVPSAAWSSPVRGERRRLARTTLKLRVASDEKRKPVWLELPMVMHRPIPTDGLVRECSVLRERVGLTWRWKAILIVETPERELAPAGTGRVSIDLGWRKLDGGVRVATWRDDTGRVGELVLPFGWLRELEKTEDLRSIRDRHFNEARAALSAWLDSAANLPEWIKAETANLARWRSQGRLARLYRMWGEGRFEGDDAAYGRLAEWWQRERHLYEYECHLRDQCLRHRREVYRLFAASLVGRYREVVLEHFDLRPIARRTKNGGKANEMWKPARHRRFLTAPSQFRLVLRNAAQRQGLEITEVKGAYTTMICSRCGAADWFDSPVGIVRECLNCGAILDQDHNAAANLLDDGFSQTRDRLGTSAAVSTGDVIGAPAVASPSIGE